MPQMVIRHPLGELELTHQDGSNQRQSFIFAAVSPRYTYYNFSRVHQSLLFTPAMTAGIADHVWSVRGLLEVS